MTLAELEVVIGANFSKLKTGMAQAKRDAVEQARGIGQSITQGIGLGIGNFSVAAVAEGFKGIFRAMVTGNAEMEKYQVQFSVLLGSMDSAKDRMRELAKFAAETPFELPEVVAASKQLQVMGGTAMATGRVLKMVGDMASASGASYQEVAMWVGRLYSSLKAGRPFGEAAQRLQELGLISGDARNKLEELQKAGAGGAQMWAVFSKESDRFSGMMEKQSKTFDGLLSTLKDDLGALLREVGAPVFEKVRNAVRSLLNYLEGDAGKNATRVLRGVVSAMLDFGGAIAVIAGVSKALQLLKAALLGLPAVAIFSAIAAAAYGLFKLVETNFGGIRDFLAGVWTRVSAFAKDAFALCQMIARRIMEVWRTIAPVVEPIIRRLSAFMSKAFDVFFTGVTLGLAVLTGNFDGAWAKLSHGTRATALEMAATFADMLGGVESGFNKMVNSVVDKLASLAEAAAPLLGGEVGKGLRDVLHLPEVSGYSYGADTLRALAAMERDAAKREAASIRASAQKAAKDGYAPFNPMGNAAAATGDGKDGKSAAEKATDSLRSKIEELTKANYLLTHSARDAELEYDLLSGQFADADEMLKGLARSVNQVNLDLQDHKDFADTLRSIYKQTQLNAAGGELERVEIERRAKGMKELTSVERAQLQAAIARRDSEVQLREQMRANNDAFASTLANLREQIALLGVTTEAERMLYNVREGSLRGLATWQKQILVWGAQRLDQLKAEREGMKATIPFWAAIALWVGKIAKEVKDEGIKRYQDELGKLQERIALTGSSAEIAAYKLELLTKEFGGGAEGARMARDILARTAVVEEIEAWTAQLHKMADTVTDTFMKMFDDLFNNGFKNFFSNVIGGFRKMLADMAREYLASQIKGLLSRVVGGIIGGLFGGGAGGSIPGGGGTEGVGGWAAVGGPVLSHKSYLVGEHGPEIFTPNSGGSITPNHAMPGSGGNVTVHMTVNTPDANSFKRSGDQIAQEMGVKVNRAIRRNR